MIKRLSGRTGFWGGEAESGMIKSGCQGAAGMAAGAAMEL